MKWIKYLALALLLFWVGSKIDWSPEPVDSCPFCNPVVLERQMVHHGEVASVIATYKPAVPGHLLIIPNRHVTTYDQLTDSEIQAIGDLVKLVHTHYIERYHATDYILIQKNGRTAGQAVPHVHVHILPRNNEISLPSFVLRFLLVGLLKPNLEPVEPIAKLPASGKPCF